MSVNVHDHEAQACINRLAAIVRAEQAGQPVSVKAARTLHGKIKKASDKMVLAAKQSRRNNP